MPSLSSMRVIPLKPSRSDPPEARRFASHVLALAAVTTLVLMSPFAPGHDTLVASSAASPDAEVVPATPAWLLPAQATLDLTAATVAASPQDASPAAIQAAAPALNPQLSLPLWVRTTQDTVLWSASDPTSGVALGSLPTSGYLKPLGQFTDGRLQVYFPGDGIRPTAQAWVDVQSLEPSPPPAWVAPAVGAGTVAPPRRWFDIAPPYVTAVHVAIIDDASGQLIYGEGPDTRVPQASTTKIATTIVALERAPDLQQKIDVNVSASAMVAADGSSTMGLEPGERVKLETLLYGMMLPSGNDAAEQVALSLGGSRATFVGWMNQEAEALGLKNTHFANPSGMDADGHYSSAYDMAMLGRYAMSNPTFRTMASTMRYASDGYPMKNLNRLLGVYPGADGVKIGETDNAGKTIVASAVHDGHRVYIGLMHSADLAGDCTALFDWAWSAFSW
jgi:D-alanyl-D-alanine carboxypeptidase